MKLLFLMLSLLSIFAFAAEDKKINKNNEIKELKKDKHKVFEEQCSQYAVKSKIPEKRLSVFMAECMASLSLGNIDEGEESISTHEKPTSKKPQ